MCFFILFGMNVFSIVEVLFYSIFISCQIMAVLKYISTFLDEHPLCSCSEEISGIKKSVIHQQDEIKLKQKTSSLSLIVTEKQYRAKYNISVPEDYPDIRVT